MVWNSISLSSLQLGTVVVLFRRNCLCRCVWRLVIQSGAWFVCDGLVVVGVLVMLLLVGVKLKSEGEVLRKVRPLDTGLVRYGWAK